jgi:hypothetical protein
MSMTAEQIEARNFTYCSAFYPEQLSHGHFIVGTASRKEALQRAHAFAEATWGEPKHINVYPRTYVKEARSLYARGLHD